MPAPFTSFPMTQGTPKVEGEFASTFGSQEVESRFEYVSAEDTKNIPFGRFALVVEGSIDVWRADTTVNRPSLAEADIEKARIILPYRSKDGNAQLATQPATTATGDGLDAGYGPKHQSFSAVVKADIWIWSATDVVRGDQVGFISKRLAEGDTFKGGTVFSKSGNALPAGYPPVGNRYLINPADAEFAAPGKANSLVPVRLKGNSPFLHFVADTE